MTMSEQPLPHVIWVAARPPQPPFDGANLKAYFGIKALAAETEVEVVTFAEPGQSAELLRRMGEFWQGKVSRIHVLEFGPRPDALTAIRQGRFQFGLSIERSVLPDTLQELGGHRQENIVVLDDIVLAPLTPRFGHNALLSPHDCISELHRSHFQYSVPQKRASKHYLQYRLARHYEQHYYHLALLTHVVTARDRFLLQRVNPAGRYHVVPNMHLPGPLSTPPDDFTWDVLVWADLKLASIVRGTRALLQSVKERRDRDQPLQMALVGRVDRGTAERVIGPELLKDLHYSPYLEDESGRLRHGRITVVPDFGGAGIKNRCLNILAAHKCLACLYPQMEGLEMCSDAGAINAHTMTELTAQIQEALQTGSFARIAAAGGALYERHFNDAVIQQAWVDMVRRAAAVRERRAW